MLSKQTVFVLGAGASVPYGFSTGATLVQKARGLSVDEMHGKVSNQHGRHQMQLIRNALQGNITSSIDAMFEHRKDLWLPLKKLMASLLYEEEVNAEDQYPPIDDDWLALITDYMAEGAPTIEAFAKNPVSFISFNYDRLLEFRLARGLALHYGKEDERAVWPALHALKIVHVHGSLGLLPDQVASTGRQLVPFGAKESADTNWLGIALQQVAQSIKLVHEACNDDAPFAEAQQLLMQAQQVFFFGFSFARRNVVHLRTELIPANSAVYCTTYGLTDAEVRDRLTQTFPQHGGTQRVQLGNLAIRKFLRNHVQIFR